MRKSKLNNRCLMSLQQLLSDPEFTSRWPYCWDKLKPFFLQKQRDYARDNKGDHTKVGLFVEFLEEVMSDLETLEVDISMKPKAVRKRLHSSHL